MNKALLIAALCLLPVASQAQEVIVFDATPPAGPASTVSLVTLRVAAATGGGLQSFTSAGFGVPKCAMFFVSSATATDTRTDHDLVSIGSTDGTNQAVATQFVEDAQGTTDSYNRGATDEVVMILDGTGAIDGEASWNAWVTDGVQVNWGVAPSVGYLVTVVLIGGSDLSCDVGTFVGPAGAGSAVDVATGFEPDNLIVWTHRVGAAAFDDVNYDNGSISIGFADNDGTATIAQFAWARVDDDAQGTVNITGGAFDDRVGANLETLSASPRNTIEITAWHAGPAPLAGFEATTRDAGTSETHTYAYLALAYNGAVEHKVGDEVGSTSTGSVAYTDAGFTPQFVFMLGTNTSTYSVNLFPTYAGLSICLWDATNQFCQATSNQDGQGTSNTSSTSQASALYNVKDSGLVEYLASLSSFGAGGWTLNWTDPSFAATLNPYLAIGE